MKRFNKIFILLLIIFCSFAFLVSCSDNKNEKDQNPSSEIKDENNNSSDNETGDNETGDNDDNEITSSIVEVKIPDISNAIISDAVKEFDLSYDLTEVDRRKDEISNIIKTAQSVDEISALYNEFEKYSDIISDKYVIAELLYYADSSNEEIIKAYDDIYKIQLDIENALTEINSEIASSKFAKEFFQGMSDEEIEYISKMEVNSELTEALLYKSKLIQEIESMDDNISIDLALIKFIENNKKITLLNGFKNDEYIKYSDSNDYYRLYSSEDVLKIDDYAKRYLLDVINELYTTYYQGEDDGNYKKRDIQVNAFMDNKALLDEYALNIGGSFYEIYNDLFDHGYYVISKNDDAIYTAFQDRGSDVALVYFGGYYNNLGTFIHEFGHYYTSIMETDNCSFDLCEVHSQGNEVLFGLYLLEQEESYATKYYEFNCISSLIGAVIDGIMIRKFEESVYRDDISNLSELWEEINEEYGYFSPRDWYTLISDYDNYYISYATSALGALSLYLYGKENGFEMAKEAYLKLCSYNGVGDLEEALTYAGLQNPFSEELFIDIMNFVNDSLENRWK